MMLWRGNAHTNGNISISSIHISIYNNITTRYCKKANETKNHGMDFRISGTDTI